MSTWQFLHYVTKILLTPDCYTHIQFLEGPCLLKNYNFSGAQTYSNMTVSPCSESPWRQGLPKLKWKNLGGLHRALPATPM